MSFAPNFPSLTSSSQVGTLEVTGLFVFPLTNKNKSKIIINTITTIIDITSFLLFLLISSSLSYI